MKFQLFLTLWLAAAVAGGTAQPPILEKLRQQIRRSTEVGDNQTALNAANQGLIHASELISLNAVEFDTVAAWIVEAMGGRTERDVAANATTEAIKRRGSSLARISQVTIHTQNLAPEAFATARTIATEAILAFFQSTTRVKGSEAVTAAEAKCKAARNALAALPNHEHNWDRGGLLKIEEIKDPAYKAAVIQFRSVTDNKFFAVVKQRDAAATLAEISKPVGEWLAALYLQSPSNAAELETLLRSRGLESSPLADAIPKNR